MKKIKVILLAFLSFTMFTGCDTNFEEINTDPDRSVELPAHLLLGYTQRFYSNTMHSLLGGAGGDMGAMWAQSWSKVQYNDEERYVPRRGVIDNIFSNLYTTVVSEATAMEALAMAEGNTNLAAVGKIMQAIGYQTLTEMYGPIPFTEAIDGGNLQPVFDDETVVFEGVIQLLTDAADMLASGSGSVTATSDLFYGGDTTKWWKLANTLKFRALMRISSTRAVGGELQALVGKMMTSNADNAQIQYLSVAPDAWPAFETIVDGNRLEYKINELMVETLESLNDPRLPVYCAPADSDGAFRGKPGGYGFPTTLPNEALGLTYANISGIGSFYLNSTLPGKTMAYSELMFLMAEAANEGYISGGLAGANTHYNAGITASFQWNGVGGAAGGYLAADGIEITSQNDGRSKIGTQKWISLFGQGYEQWTEWRRTKVPVLSPVFEADLSQIPSRYFYPTTEPSFNRANYDDAVSRIGGDELTSGLYWQ